MLFRRHGQIREPNAVPTGVMFNTPSPQQKLDSTPPTTLEEILHRSKHPSRPWQHKPAPVNKHLPSLPQDTRDGHNKNLPRRTPTSRKTGFATIRTDSTDSQPAFESDAFAVLMPTTRLPILDRTITPPKPTSPAARAEAVKTYQEKARQGRERNNSQGIQIPSKLVSYSSRTTTRAAQGVSMQVNASPPGSPRNPAGSFPVSPPLPQVGWTQPARRQEPTKDAEGRSNICTPRKPITTHTANISPSSTYRVYRSSPEAEGSRSVSSSPTTIKIRLKPKFVEPVNLVPVQMESGDDLYRRKSPDSSIRSLSPSKSMPNFTRQHSVEGDSIFGYEARTVRKETVKTETTSGHTPKKDSTDTTEKDELKRIATPKRTFASRLPWLRTAIAKPAKPSTPPPAAPTVTTPRVASAEYIDPFTSFTTPISTPKPKNPTPATSHSSSPKKLARPKPNPTMNHNPSPPNLPASRTQTPPPRSPTPKFDTGFSQIQTFLIILLKAGIVVYGIMAIWYILDALRDAVNTICVPFRALRWMSSWLGIVVLWVLRLGVVVWEWGVVRVLGGAKGGRWWW